MDLNIAKFRLASDEFVVTGNTKSGKVRKLDEVIKINAESMNNFEAWSKVILREVFKVKQQESLL